LPAGREPLVVWVQRLDDALPQTQCTRCGYPDCHGYAEAMAKGEAGINQCPPGGQEGIERLAAILNEPVVPLDPEHGVEGPLALAVIDESWCIGCTLCIEACPVDAIVGTHKRMHTVIEPHCTGCELCVPVCPVDCIQMEPVSGNRTGWSAWSAQQADHARLRYADHKVRVGRAKLEHQERLERKAQHKLEHLAEVSKHTDPTTLERKRSIIEAALARARAARESNPS